jgi:predicted naringenin-chalcone synthase
MTSVDTLPEMPASRAATVGLWGIGTATPTSVAQGDIAPLAEELACRTDKERSFLQRVFLRSGVERRGSVLVKEDGDFRAGLRGFYPTRTGDTDMGPTTAQRMIAYAREAPELAEKAAVSAIDHAGISAESITHLVTVSCTGFFAPGLDVEMIRRLGLNSDIRRTHIGFMGCHAAFNALAAARHIVNADPSALVMVVCVELSTLHFAYGFDMQKIVANALFADGAAAAIVGEARDGAGYWRLRHCASALLPDTLEAMTWRIRDHGFEMTLAPELPAIVRTNVRGWCERWLHRADVSLPDVHGWAVHPGGPKILSAVEEALELPPDALQASREILARHGNMSSGTILFVLQQMARAGPSSNGAPCVAMGFGPGLMLEGMLLDRG